MRGPLLKLSVNLPPSIRNREVSGVGGLRLGKLSNVVFLLSVLLWETCPFDTSLFLRKPFADSMPSLFGVVFVCLF